MDSVPETNAEMAEEEASANDGAAAEPGAPAAEQPSLEAPAPEAAAPAPKIPCSVTVRGGHVQPLWAGHPWVFQQAIERVDGQVEPGDEVLIIDPNGKILGRGLASPRSAISVRLFTSRGSQAIDGVLIRERIDAAIALRRASGLPDPGRTTGFRLVHGEGDGLPGLIVDAFDDVLVVQLGTIGLKRRQQEIVAALVDAFAPRAILDRTPKALAHTEGFDPGEGPSLLHGEPPENLTFHELGLKHEIPIALAQKTGYYFDQRPLRERIGALSRDALVLDAFCYTGSIALAAARGGARKVLGVDKSVAAILTGAHNAEINGYAGTVELEELDAYQAFKRAAAQGGADVVISDPPKLATGRRVRDQAMGAYRKLAASACAAVKPGGLLAFCSCSGSVTQEALQRALALGARDVQRRAVIVERLFQGADHPVPAAFPEGLYLKVLLARVAPV
jgi:23S rRNA (cytosine1962-C5)-methyltransferase